MGSPEFAVPAFRAIAQSEHEIVGVYTRKPKPAGRGKKVSKTPIHEIADAIGLQVYTPKTLRDKDVLEEFAGIAADVVVVVAYGLILPKEVLEHCKFGAINIHPSLLPRWRGAAPIQRTIMAGDKHTGVCIMNMDEGLDTGDVLRCKELELDDEVTAGDVHDELAEIGGDLLLKVLNKIGSIEPMPQSQMGVTYADKIHKDEAKINWDEKAEIINNKIRGLNPFPGAYFEHEGERIKVFEISCQEALVSEDQIGQVIDDKLGISCRDAIIHPLMVQKPGGKKMSIEEFLLGRK